MESTDLERLQRGGDVGCQQAILKNKLFPTATMGKIEVKDTAQRPSVWSDPW